MSAKMTKPKVNQDAVNVFLAALDLSVPKGYQLVSAKIDALSYGWNSATLYHVLDGIEKAYERRDKDELV